MDTCHHCGSGINVVKPECGTCGTAAPRAHEKHSDVDLSPAWHAKFALIDKAGGPSLSGLKALPVSERFKLMNWWALVFGAFYYLAKGMWRKAISLSVALSIAALLLDLVMESLEMPSNGMATGAAAAIFGIRANIDYYKKIVLRQNGWW
jgi:hypothetical protein